MKQRQGFKRRVKERQANTQARKISMDEGLALRTNGYAGHCVYGGANAESVNRPRLTCDGPRQAEAAENHDGVLIQRFGASIVQD
jgi:hypothetical protein